MAFLDKLKFWKKEDSFAELDKQLGTLNPVDQEPSFDAHQPTGFEQGFGESADESALRSASTGLETSNESGFQSFGMQHPGEKRASTFEAPIQRQNVYEVSSQPVQNQNIQQQLEVVSAKLDTIRIAIESINHRLVALERTMHASEYEEPVVRRKRGVW